MIHAGFYAWAAVALVMIFSILNFSAQRKKRFLNYTILFSLWIIYIVILSRSGILTDFSLPPRLPLLVVIPTIVASIVITRRNSFHDVLMRTPRHVPVYLQSFRIVVELLIYGAFINGVFPERVTFEGLNFDILAGVSAPVIAYLYQRHVISDKVLAVWNLLALLILSVTVYSFISSYYGANDTEMATNTDLVKLPYLLLPSIMLPVAIFLHIFSLRQLQLHKRTP